MRKMSWGVFGFLISALLAVPYSCTPTPALATVSNTITETVSGYGDGTSTNFPITFDFRHNTWITVTLYDTSTVPTTVSSVPVGVGGGSFSITGGDPGTTVVMGTPPTTTQFIIIARTIPQTQPVVFSPASIFPYKGMSSQLDAMTLMIQDLGAEIAAVAGGGSTVPGSRFSTVLVSAASTGTFYLVGTGSPSTAYTTLNNFPGFTYNVNTGVLNGVVASANALTPTPTTCSGAQFSQGILPNGNSNCSTISIPPGTTPGGASTYVQYNNAGAFGGVSTFTLGASTVTVPGLVDSALVAQPVLSNSLGQLYNALISLTANVSGVTPVANGGTNSSTALSNNFVIISSAGKLVESATTTTQLGYLDATSSIQTQLNGKQASGTYIKADGTVPMAATLSMGTNLITNVVDPTTAQGAATKNYVDTQLAQLNPAAAVVAASTGDNPSTYTNAVSGVCIGDTLRITSTAAFVLDGITPTVGQRVLLKDQTSSFQDGVWTLTTAANVGVLGALLTRALDFDSSADINSGQIIPVAGGTTLAGSSWYQTANNTTCNTSTQTWTKFQNAASAYLLSANNLSDVASKSTSFNNVSPITTTGDMIYSASGATNSRLAVGGASSFMNVTGGVPVWSTPTQATAFLNLFTSGLQGLVPASGGSSTTAFLNQAGTFTTPAGGAPSYAPLTKTANYTAVGGDFIFADFSGGSFTITLPDATTNAGKRILVLVSGYAPPYLLTIAAAGSDTFVGGDTTYLLTELGDGCTLSAVLTKWACF